MLPVPQFHRCVSAVLLLAALALAGCSTGTFLDDDALGLEREDYAGLVEPPAETEAPPPFPDEPPIPDLHDTLVAPAVPPVLPDRLVTVSVTDDIPLKDVLFEMARQAGVDMEIDPRITGGITFSARQRPFLDVIDRIASLTGLRYSAADNAVRVEIDDPYFATYRLPQLAGSRDLDSETRLRTGLVDESGATDEETGSEVQITLEYESDLFEDLVGTLESIVRATQPPGLGISGGDSDQISVNRQAGIITVFGTSRQHQAVAQYLDDLMTNLSAQVLIEARVVEVTLDEGFNRGIDWDVLLQESGVGSIAIGSPSNPALGPLSTDAISFSVDGDDANALLRLAESYGSVRALSSPRLTILNNQTALLKVAQNFVYFRLEAQIEEEENEGGADDVTVVFNSRLRTLPIGFSMSVQPAIDLARNRVTLTLRPSVTQISSFVQDPAITFNSAVFGVDLDLGSSSQIPVVDIREIDSVLQLDSGRVAVLGGLMQQRVRVQRSGLPGRGWDNPIDLVTGTEASESDLVELVIFLRATVLPNPPLPDSADERLYQRFTRDPRPIAF